MRVVGFQDSLRKCLPSHCKIKRARDSDDLEVMLNAGTRLTNIQHIHSSTHVYIAAWQSHIAQTHPIRHLGCKGSICV